MQVITNTDPGNFTIDGIFVDQIPSTPSFVSPARSGRILVVGTGNYGDVDVATPFSSPATDGQTAFGNDTSSTHSLMLAALSASPECIDFEGVRVTNGADTAATIALLDTAGSPATWGTLTFRKTGTLPTTLLASSSVALQSGIITGSPVFALTVNFPGRASEVFSNLIGYATVGSGLDMPTLKASAAAAINGTAPGSQASQYVIFSAGGGTATPNVASTFLATGGNDGSSGVGTADLIGSPTLRTGIYAGSTKISNGQLLIANFTDATATGTLKTFRLQENCLAHIAAAANQTTQQAIATRAANSISDAGLVYSMDWDYMFDSFAGIQRLVNPSGKVAGVIASQPDYLYPGNKPPNGVAGITATERTNSTPDVAEGGQRQQAGILYVTNNSSLYNNGNGVSYGLPHGMAADGITPICDTRMLQKISADLQPVLGPLVGQMQSSAVNDPIRKLANDRLDAYFDDLLNGSPQQISAYNVVADLSNNSVLSISQGKLIVAIAVTTLAPVKYIIAMLQVGSTVQIVTLTP